MGARQAKVGRVIENPFKDKRGEPAIDLIFDSVEILKRYDNIFRALILRGVKMGGFRTKPFTLLTREFTEADIGRNMRYTVLYFSTAHAFQGAQYVGDILTNMQYTVLQAALILTITVTLYISPPAIEEERLQIIFSALLGFSSLCHLGTIISCTILCAVFNGAISEVDTTIMFIQNHRIYSSVTAFNYIAIVAALASMMVAGYARTYTEGNIQLVYSIVMIVVLVFIGLRSGNRVYKNQDVRAFAFYKQYCDPDGQLKSEYLELIYPSDDSKKVL